MVNARKLAQYMLASSMMLAGLAQASNSNNNNNEDPVSGRIQLAVLDMHKEGDRSALQQILDAQLEAHKASRLYNDVQPTINKMVELWRQENPDFSKSITDEYSSKLVAEAWFWSKNLGLFDVLTASGWDTYDKIRAFQPLGIMHGMREAPAGLKEKIKLVSNKMVVPSMSHEASYALGQAAWTYFVSKIGVEEFEKLKALQKKE